MTVTKNEIQIFNNPQFGEIRISGTSEQPLFCLADVCKALDLKNPRSVKTTLKQGGVHTMDGVSITTNQYGKASEQIIPMNFIDEPNLYKCIFQSRKPEAEAFQDWVCGEILPSIRRTGGYLISRPEETPEMLMARALQVANDTIARNAQRVQMLQGEKDLLEKENKSLAPKAQYTDSVLQSPTTYTMTQMAKELDMSVIAFSRELIRRQVMYKQSGQWMLYAKFQGRGYTKSRTHSFQHADGTTGSNTITVFTEHGRAFIHAVFKKYYSPAAKGGDQ